MNFSAIRFTIARDAFSRQPLTIARCFSVSSATCWIPLFPMSFSPFRLKPTIRVVKAPSLRSSAVITRNALASADFGAGSHCWNPSFMTVNSSRRKRRWVFFKEFGRHVGCPSRAILPERQVFIVQSRRPRRPGQRNQAICSLCRAQDIALHPGPRGRGTLASGGDIGVAGIAGAAWANLARRWRIRPIGVSGGVPVSCKPAVGCPFLVESMGVSQSMVHCRRFWLPRGDDADLSDDGFLVDPESEFARYTASTAVPFESIEVFPVLILLGEPGIGKTTALEGDHDRIKASVSKPNNRVFWVDLSLYGSDALHDRRVFRSKRFRSLKGVENVHIFFDGLDECLMRVPSLVGLLLEFLSDLRPDRLLVRIACRTADWPPELESGLRVPVAGSPPGSSRRAGGYSPVLRLTADEVSLPLFPCPQKFTFWDTTLLPRGTFFGSGPPVRSRTPQGRFPPARLLHPGGRCGMVLLLHRKCSTISLGTGLSCLRAGVNCHWRAALNAARVARRLPFVSASARDTLPESSMKTFTSTGRVSAPASAGFIGATFRIGDGGTKAAESTSPVPSILCSARRKTPGREVS